MSYQNSKCHVAIITYHMIPYTKMWGASQRMYYLATNLKDNQYDVSVLHASFGLNTSEKKINFDTKKVLIKPNFIQRLQNRMQSTKNVHSKSPKKENIIRGLTKRIHHTFERIFFNDFNYIGAIIYFWNKQAWVSLKKIFNEKNTKVVILSGPYFTTFSLIDKIKKNYPNIKIIIDYRDPWNLLNKGSKHTIKKEQRYLDIADNIVFFSEMFKKKMCEKFVINEKKCLTVYNGYDQDLWEQIKSEKVDNKLIISYVGSHITFEDSDYRNPTVLINSVIKFKNSPDIILNFVGCHDRPKNIKELLKTGVEINFKPVLPHREALEYMKKSDVLVILTTDEYPSLFTVTGKLFDCIMAGTYILGISNNQKIDYIQIIEKLRIGFGCGNNEFEIIKSLEIIHKKWINKELNNLKVEERFKFSRRYQNKKIISTINKLVVSV